MDNLSSVKNAEGRELLLILPSLIVGGAERVCVTLANALAASGWRVSIVTGNGTGPLRSDIAPGVLVIDLGVDRVTSMLLPLVRILRAHPHATVLSAMTHMNVVTLLARKLSCRFKGRVAVQEVALFSSGRTHGSRLRRKLVELAMKALYRFADRILVVSDLIGHELAILVPTVAKNITTLPNPVDLARVAAMANAPAPHDWLTAPRKAPVFVSVARLSREKGVDVLVRALAALDALDASRTEARLIIIGAGPERDRLAALVQSLDLVKRVAFVGYSANPWAFMAHADALVLSSNAEGFGMVLVEAMSCGCQVVSTRCGSAPVDILDNGRLGELVAVNQPDDLACAMARSLDTRRPVADLRAKAEEYDAPMVTKSYAALLQELGGI